MDGVVDWGLTFGSTLGIAVSTATTWTSGKAGTTWGAEALVALELGTMSKLAD